MNEDRTTWQRVATVVAGVIMTLLATPTAAGAGWVVFWGLRGQSYWDLGWPTYEYGEIAGTAGLGVFLLLAGSLLVLIHGFTRSLAITTLGVIWMVVWIPVFVIAIIS